MSRFRSSLIVALGVAALAIPAGAVANQGANHGKAKGHGKTHNVAYVFKGLYVGPTTVVNEVEVKAGNSRVRKGGFVNTTVAFDLTNARIVVADTNGDGTRNLEDVKKGDKVVVKAMLPRKNPGSQPFTAKRLVDQTHRAS